MNALKNKSIPRARWPAPQGLEGGAVVLVFSSKIPNDPRFEAVELTSGMLPRIIAGSPLLVIYTNHLDEVIEVDIHVCWWAKVGDDGSYEVDALRFRGGYGQPKCPGKDMTYVINHGEQGDFCYSLRQNTTKIPLSIFFNGEWLKMGCVRGCLGTIKDAIVQLYWDLLRLHLEFVYIYDLYSKGRIYLKSWEC